MSSGVYIPQDFIDALRARVTGFNNESERNQWGLALMAWERYQKRRLHLTMPGALSFSTTELVKLFGRDKYAPMRRTGFATWSSNWSHSGGTTRAYRLSLEVCDALKAYAAFRVPDSVDMLMWHGTRIKTVRSLPRAISSTGTSGKTTKTADWDCAKRMNKVPVNEMMLQALQQWLEDQLAAPEVDYQLQPILERLSDTVLKVLRISNASLAGPGNIPQVYAIAPTGRLYARGLNLQNASSLVKDAALHGLWEYDFANCHFSIVAQMAKNQGTPCPLIEHYLANKNMVRRDIAASAEITVDQCKRCLLALLYGAKTSSWVKSAIPSILGEDAARRLYDLPRFQALSAELDVARRAVLSNWPKTANGSLTNISGKAIRGGASAARKLAHLAQGVEAGALKAIVRIHADDIVLLQHDGFVARRRLDCASLERAVMEATGYLLQMEEEQINLHVDAESLAIRTKSDMALEAAPGLDLDPNSAD